MAGLKTVVLIEQEGLKSPSYSIKLCRNLTRYLFNNNPKGLKTVPSNSMAVIFKP